MSFAVVLVVGHAGSGKSTFCAGIQQLVQSLNQSPKQAQDNSFFSCSLRLVNLDPANDLVLPYDAHYNVCTDLTNLERVMQDENLGPNGAMLRAMEIIERHLPYEEIFLNDNNETDTDATGPSTSIVYLIDLPGQVELFVMHDSLLKIVNKISKLTPCVCSVNLTDATMIAGSEHRLLATNISSLQIALHLGTPMIHCASKIDLLLIDGANKETYVEYLRQAFEGDLDYIVGFNQESNAEGEDQGILTCKAELTPKARLTEAIKELLDEHGTISYIPYDIQDKRCMVFIWSEMLFVSGLLFEATGGDPWQVARSEVHFEEHLDYVLGLIEKRAALCASQNGGQLIVG